MDFNKVNESYFNYSPSKKKEKKTAHNKNHPEQNHNTKSTPNNPTYWQSAVGIKNNQLSFKGGAEDKIAEEEFINSQLEEIKHKQNTNPCLSEYTHDYKTNMQELASKGKQAVINYTSLVKKGVDFSYTTPQMENFNQALDKTIQQIPADIDKINLDNIFNFLRILANPNYFQNPENSKQLFDIFNTVLSLENGNNNEKIQYLKIIFEKVQNSPYNSLNLLPPDKTLLDFNFFHQAAEFIGEGSERENFFNMNFDIEEKKSILDKFYDEDINTEDYKNFVVQCIKTPGKSPLRSINTIINTDESRKQLFKRLIDKRTSQPPLDAKSVLQLLDEKKDTKNITELLDYIHKKYDKDQPQGNIPPNILLNVIDMIDSSNISGFKEYSEHMPIDCAIKLALDYKNPVTKLFDKKLQEKIIEFADRGMSAFYVRSIANACIDKTGILSPTALEVVDILCPKKNEGKLDSIKRRLKTGSKIKFDSFCDDISPLLNSLKNKDGEFSQDNVRFLFYIIKTNKKHNKIWEIPLYELQDIMEGVKDKDGNLDRYKANIAVKILEKSKSYAGTAIVLKALSEYPDNKQRLIYNTCINIGKGGITSFLNFPAFAKYCFNDEGKVNTKKIELIQKLVNTNDIHYSYEYLKLFDKYPQLENWLTELTKAVSNTEACYKLDFIIKEHINSDGNIDKDLQNYIFKYLAIKNNLEDFESMYTACKDENGNIDSEVFNKALELMEFTYKMPITLNSTDFVDIVKQNFSLTQLNFKDKVNLLNSLKTVQSLIPKEELLTKYNYIQSTIAALESSLSFDNIGLPIDKETKTNFIRNIFQSSSKNYELTPFEKIMTESIPLLEQMPDGLNLSYSRKEFLEDLSTICDDDNKINILSKKTGITPIYNKDDDDIKITGYNGLIKLNELDTNDPFEKSVFECMNKFMYDNKVQTGNTKLDEQLNYIVKAFPEFINIIGKKQHGTHAYTLDIHSLLVLAHSVENPDYLKDLNQSDRSLLKLAAIFHDIMKQENVVDKGHQNLSSIYTKRMITKIISSEEIVDRVYELIDNHHWSEEYSNSVIKEDKAQDLAFRFRRPNDFDIEKIIARADLMSVNPEFYERFKDCLSADNLAPIQKYLDYLYSTGNALFNNKILMPSKLDNHIEEKDGVKYKVINLHSLDDNTDMSEFGFEYGLKKKDLKLLVHMVDSKTIYNSLNTVKLLSSPSNKGMLSESLISPKHKRTYCDRKYGVVLSQINTNIVTEAKSNQSSGTQKELSSIYNLIFHTHGTNHRENFKTQLSENLGIGYKEISDKEYGDFYKNVLASKSSLSEISDTREFKLGKYTITGKKLKEAIIKYQDDLIDKTEQEHNEIVGYTPKIQAVIAKSKNLNNVPDELLRFARENNYPVILI